MRTREPEQLGERRLVLERPGQNPLLHYAYHAIAAADPREPALNLLQTILVGGDASRLHRALVEEQRLAVAIGGGWPEGFDAQSVHIAGDACRPVRSVESSRRHSMPQLARLVQHGVSAQELQRAKNMAAADFWRGVSTIDGKARLLGEYAVHARRLPAAVRRARGLRARDARGRAEQLRARYSTRGGAPSAS